MNPVNFFLITYIVIAIVFVFPLIGIMSDFAEQTCHRHLEILKKNQSQISLTVELEHV